MRAIKLGFLAIAIVGCTQTPNQPPPPPPPPPGPMCGNGKCETGETSKNCCDDCGCTGTDVCTAGECVSSAKCGDGRCDPGETSATCCVDCRCPSGSTCDGTTCALNDVCGDGVCGSTENAGNCCQDCGCSAPGMTCTGGSRSCLYVGTSTLTWNITDSCANGDVAGIAFYDRNAHWKWPSGSNVYVLSAYTSYSIQTTCATGDYVCYGANQPNHSGYWGVDIDDSQSCASCCYLCETGTPVLNLTCN